MGHFSKKIVKDAVDVTEIFLKVQGYLDEDGNPTDKSKGMLMLDAEGGLIIIKMASVKFKGIIMHNQAMLSFIANIDNIKYLTTPEIRQQIINTKRFKL